MRRESRLMQQAPASVFVRARTHLHTSRHAHAFSSRQTHQLTNAPRQRKEEKRGKEKRETHASRVKTSASRRQPVCLCVHAHTYIPADNHTPSQAGRQAHELTNAPRHRDACRALPARDGILNSWSLCGTHVHMLREEHTAARIAPSLPKRSHRYRHHFLRHSWPHMS